MSSSPPPEEPAPIPDPPREEAGAPPAPPPPAPPVVTPLASGGDMALAARLAGRTPISNLLALSIAALHLYLYAGVLGPQHRAPGLEDLSLALPTRSLVGWGALVPSLVREGGEWWRVLVAPLLHLNSFQLVLSVLFVRSICPLGERLLGRGGLALGLLGGAIGSAAWTIAKGGVLVGAYGAAMGVSGAIVVALRGRDLPPLAAALRRRLVRSLAFDILIGLGINFFLAASGWPAVFATDLLLGGFLGGLAAGVVLAPPHVPWPSLAPSRRALHSGALALALAGSLAMALTGNRGVARLLVWARGGDWIAWQLERDRPRASEEADVDASAHLVPGLTSALRPESVPSLGVALDLPSGWSRLQLSKDSVAFGPSKGAPFLQIHVIRVPPGAVGPDYSDPDTLLGELTGELGRAGAEDIVAAPFQKVRLGGLPASRIEIRYRQGGSDLQQIDLVARGRRSIYLVMFLGLDESAAAIAARLAAGMRFTEEAGE